QQAAFPQRLPDQSEVEHLQVAQAAVDQLRRPGAGPGRPVTHLDQPDPQAAGAGVQGCTRTDHTTTDHQDVELLGGGGLTCRRALCRVQSTIHGPDTTGPACDVAASVWAGTVRRPTPGGVLEAVLT